MAIRSLRQRQRHPQAGGAHQEPLLGVAPYSALDLLPRDDDVHLRHADTGFFPIGIQGAVHVAMACCHGDSGWCALDGNWHPRKCYRPAVLWTCVKRRSVGGNLRFSGFALYKDPGRQLW